MPLRRSEETNGIARGSKKKKTGEHSGGKNIRQGSFARVNRACFRCRSKKAKCDGHHPSCSACDLAKEVCSYQSFPRKRGLPSGYVRLLEMLWGCLLDTIEGSGEVVIALLTERVAKRGGQWRSSMLEKWKSSTLLKEVERILPIVEILNDRDPSDERTLPQENERTTNDQAPETFSNIARWRMPGQEFDDGDLMPSHIPDGSVEQNDPIVVDGDTLEDEASRTPISNTSYSGSEAKLETGNIVEGRTNVHRCQCGTESISKISGLSLPPNAWRLFDIYFVHTHCWLPIIDKGDIYKLAHSYSRRSLDVKDSACSGTHSALWAILALASHQDSAQDEQRTLNKSFEEVEWSSTRLYNAARNLIPQEEANYELGHVQALLLLSLIKCGAGSWSAAWLLIGQAVRIVLAIGSSDSLKTSEEHIIPIRPDRRQTHVFLSCFIIDTFVSVMIGKPPHLRTDALAEAGRLMEDGIEEWGPWATIPGLANRGPLQDQPLRTESTFNELLKLASILNDFTSDFSNGRIPSDQYSSILGVLRSWSKSLPAQCQLPNFDNGLFEGGICPLPQVLILHLLFASTLAMLQLRANVMGSCEILSKTNSAEAHGSLPTHVLCLLRCYSNTYGVATIAPVLEISVTSAARYVIRLGNPPIAGSRARPTTLEVLETMVPRFKSGFTRNRRSMKDPIVAAHSEEAVGDRTSSSTNVLNPQDLESFGAGYPSLVSYEALPTTLATQRPTLDCSGRMSPAPGRTDIARYESLVRQPMTNATPVNSARDDTSSFVHSEAGLDTSTWNFSLQANLIGQEPPVEDMDWFFNEIDGLNGSEL